MSNGFVLGFAGRRRFQLFVSLALAAGMLEPSSIEAQDAQPAQPVQPARQALLAPTGSDGAAPAASSDASATTEEAPAVAPSNAPLSGYSEVAGAPRPSPADEVESDEYEEEPSDYPRFDGRLRLIGGANYRATHPTSEQVESDSRQPFFLKQARVKVSAELNKWVRLSMSADVEAKPAIRSAFANLRVKRYLQFRVGRFKRPMSRLELTSVGDLPFIDRGIFNSAIIETAGWGDRALGVMVHGKFKKLKLNYSLAGMNSADAVDTPSLERLRGGDVLARVQWSPLRALRVGLNGGHKVTEGRVNGPNLDMNAFGADARVRFGPLEWNVEFLMAQNSRPPASPAGMDRSPWAANVVTYGQLDLMLSQDVALQPTFFFEWADTDLDLLKDESIRGLLGVNLVVFEKLRLMPYVELVRPLGDATSRSLVAYENYAFALSLQI